MSRQPNNNGINADLSYVNYNANFNGNNDMSRRRLSGEFNNGYNMGMTTNVNGTSISRRGSRDLTQDVQRLRNEGVRGQLLQEIELITIPAGTRLNLWDGKHITDAHFVSPADLNVLIRRGHGSMYNLLQRIAYPEDVANRPDSGDLNQLWDETKEAFKSIPLVRNLVNNKGRFNDAISMVLSQAQGRSRIDAILMAYTHDGKIGLHFVKEGNALNPAIFNQ